MTVGRSWRTPAKHGLMNAIVGAEVGAGGALPAIQRMRWYDLTAGDGVVAEDLVWRQNCSPGILAHHARRAVKPLAVTLFEIKPATYDRLLASLEAEMPRLGYVGSGAFWRHGENTHVEFRAVAGSGADVDVSHILRTDAVLVSNDPNAITDWAMRPGLAQEIDKRTPWFRSISTMGCNTAGLKRLERSEREGWFDLLSDQEIALPDHRDLLLAAIQRDDAQWAYLLCEPVKWRDRVDRTVVAEFQKHGKEVDRTWFGTQRAEYEQAKRRLFLTRSERKGDAT